MYKVFLSKYPANRQYYSNLSINHVVVWSIKCEEMVKHLDQRFLKSQSDVLNCLVL